MIKDFSFAKKSCCVLKTVPVIVMLKAKIMTLLKLLEMFMVARMVCSSIFASNLYTNSVFFLGVNWDVFVCFRKIGSNVICCLGSKPRLNILLEKKSIILLVVSIIHMYAPLQSHIHEIAKPNSFWWELCFTMDALAHLDCCLVQEQHPLVL